jgi:hypothetical protein
MQHQKDMPETSVTDWAPATLFELCDRYPAEDGRLGAFEVLRKALEQEEQRPKANQFWLGWRWRDVRGQPMLLHQLELAGIIRVVHNARSGKAYRLVDAGRVRQSLSAYQSAPSTAPMTDAEFGPINLPDAAFDVIVGYEKVKSLLRRAMVAPKPVHVLLEGPPASGKTLFLGDLAQVPNSRYVVGGNTTKAGLLDYLVSQPNCQLVIMDEADKGTAMDLSALLSLMETGILTRLQHGKAEHERRPIRVIAGANRIDRMPNELLSRFVVTHLAAYTDAQFKSVVYEVLTRREGIDGELARDIALALVGRTVNVRMAVQVARLCHSDRQALPETLELVGL